MKEEDAIRPDVDEIDPVVADPVDPAVEITQIDRARLAAAQNDDGHSPTGVRKQPPQNQVLVPGVGIDLQAWYRDPPNPGGANLTNAGRFVLFP